MSSGIRSTRLVGLLICGALVSTAAAFGASQSADAPAGKSVSSGASGPIAITHTTLIDGNGGPPEQDATLIITGGKIATVGPAHQVAVPRAARIIDGSKLWVVPGLINANVAYLHLDRSEAGRAAAATHHGEPAADDAARVILETAAQALRDGVTTIMESETFAKPAVVVRDRIARGEALGARIVVRGHVIGWGPTLSATMGGPYYDLPDGRKESIQRMIARENEDLILGVGEDLMTLPLDAMRARVNAYIDLGIDQIKYAGTTHSGFAPVMAQFTFEQQRAIIDVAHRRGITVAAHTTSVEGMRQCAQAGVDVFIHANAIFEEIPDDVVDTVVRSGAYCSIQLGPGNASWHPAIRTNATKLIKAGCKIIVQDEHGDAGFSPVATMEELVHYGMTPLQIITAATKTGAMSANLLAETGTVERGKAADLILLRADPSADIRNLRQIEMVMRAGVAVPGSKH